MTDTAILWRRLDVPGHDVGMVRAVGARWHLFGCALSGEEGRICMFRYEVICDDEWRTLTGVVDGWIDAMPVRRRVSVDDGIWMLDDREVPGVAGCLDLDLSFSPITNTAAIRRLDLPIGAEARVRSAWLTFPELTLEPLEQTYLRISDELYHYTSLDGDFRAELRVNAAGLVVDYGGLWRAEELGASAS